MNIAIFTRVLPHHGIGGMQAVVWDLARIFSRLGSSVTVVTGALPGRPQIFHDDGVRIIALSGVPWNRYSAAWWRGARNAFAHLAPTCDVVLGVSAAANSLLPLRNRFPQIPFVMQAHGTSVGEVLSKWRTGKLRNMLSSARNVAWIFKDLRAYAQYDNIVAVGGRVETDLRAAPIHWSLPSGRVQLISNGIDTGLFRPDMQVRQQMRASFGWGDDTHVVVSASRLHAQKGVDLSLNAVSMLSRRMDSVRYLIVGDGPERRALEEHAARVGLRERVHFAGAVSRDVLPGYLQAADTMLFTTTHVEVGLPLNVLEALATGLPCVVSRHLFDNAMFGSNLFKVLPHDKDAVANALERALTIGASPQSELPQNFSLAACAEAYIDLFSDLSNRRSGTKSTKHAHV
ncbi:hypothetical protein PTKU46_47610 [Paraburkholderia terrae]|uniref:glycosyltransferase family 4 protein n=1 Tax=Paraburkholderia terrae TaxID=311230 RepID=UPI0030E00C09